MSANAGDKKTIYCNVCLGDRCHTVLFFEERRHEDRDGESNVTYWEINEYIVAECDGCKHITFLVEVDSNSVGGNYTVQYPPRTIRREPQWLFDLMLSEMFINPVKHEFIKEIYRSLRNDNPRLAVIGIRALLEQIMFDHVGDKGSFNNTVNAFEKEGYISRVQKEIVVPLIEAGNASVHRGFKATEEQVVQLMDIVENLLETLYIHKKQVEKLKIPKRSNEK